MRNFPTILLCLLIATNAHGQSGEAQLKITPLTGDFYVFTTYNEYRGNRTGAKAMYLVTPQGVALFDTPWDTTQFQPLLDSIEARHGKKVVLVLSTHFHEDRTGGLAYYRQQGIPTYTTRLTDEWSRKRGMNRARFLMQGDTVFRLGNYRFHTYYPGPGHAPDNIVIWFEKERVLYGGCLIKSVEDENLGNLVDANVKAYASTVRKVIARCPKPRYIITGHNDFTNTGSLRHTLKMAERLNNSNR